MPTNTLLSSMPRLKRVLTDSRRPVVDGLLWCLVALGIVPAVISQGLTPFDILSPQFGFSTTISAEFPRQAGVAIFVFGAALGIARKQLLPVLLLLPWLVIGVFEIDRLNAQRPTFSQVQEQLRNNQLQVKENEKLPSTEAIREDLALVQMPNNALLRFDENQIRQTLAEIDQVFERYGSGLENKVAAISKAIAQKSKAIVLNQVALGLQRARAAQLKPLLKIPFVNIKSQYKNLQKSIRKLQKKRNALNSSRNALRAKLDDTTQSQARYGVAYVRLFALQAEVKTHLWISQSYQSWYYSLPYKLLCFTVFIVLLCRFALGSWLYLVFVIASLIAAQVYVEAPMVAKLWAVLKFVIASLLLRATYLVVTENLPLLRAQAKAFLMATLATTLKYYLPILVLVGIGFGVSLYQDKIIDAQLYATDLVKNSTVAKNTRRYDIDIAIDSYFRQQESTGHARLDALSNKSGQTVQGVAREVVAIYQDLFKPELPQMNPAFSVPKCNRFYHWFTRTGKCVEKEVKLPLNDVYGETQARQLGLLQESSQTYAAQSNKQVKLAIRIAKHDLSDHLTEIKAQFKTQLNHIYLVIDIYRWLSTLVLFVVILKSLLYIFSRIFFAADKFEPTRAIQFERDPRPAQQTSVVECAEVLKLTAKMGDTIFVNKKYDFANAPPDEVTPQPFKAFFSRFSNKVWHLNQIKPGIRENSKNLPYRRIPENERIVIWTLKPGERVVFSWKTFVGMSAGIDIRTQYSWQLSSLIFGRMFFVVASVAPESTTDGTLLLVAKGNDGIKKSTNPSNSPDQLLAWQTTTRFQLQAKLSFRNIYRSGIQIKAKATERAVMHLSEGKRTSGAAMFLKYFIIPI